MVVMEPPVPVVTGIIDGLDVDEAKVVVLSDEGVHAGSALAQ